MPAPNARARTTTTAANSAPAARAQQAGEVHELTNYRLAERLGQEELATVYRATHLTLDRPVQVAILRRTDWISTSRFQLAARLAARLSHPNILPVVDAGHDQRYGDYIVTPQMEAQTLEQLLLKGPLEALAALRIFTQIGAALDYLHEQQVYHRDVRPANILVTPQHTAYLTNFSLASAPDTPDLSSIEEADYLTPYSAPEQNLTASDRSPALDLYSLGAVLYHMLSGDVPPGSGQPLRSLSERDLTLASADRVIRRLLAEEPGQRFGNAAQATTALRQSLRKQIDQSTDDMQESRWEAMAEWLENPLEAVLAERLSSDFVTRSRARADTLHRSGAIKRFLDRWSRHGFLRRPALGQIVDPDQIVSYNIYFYELKTHYETRTPVQTRQQPHTGGKTVTPGTLPELWDTPVPTLEPFVDAPPEQITMPGSQQSVPCGECNGATQILCKTCNGKGAIQRSRRVKGTDGSIRNETFQENCPTCRGYGRQQCARCEGAGHLLQEKFFTWSRHGRIYFNEDDLNGLHKLTLETQLEQVFQERINPHEPSWHQVAPIREMLEQAINGGGPDSRLIAAELTIRGVPVTEVDFQYRNKQRSLALVGFKDVVRGDLTLVDLERAALYATVAVLLLAVIVFAVLGARGA
ncbi:MAG TPA: protein kinase [Roseiflexaceae bacterium]|nr:protein kinase [Roseiflexaceae bacterium]